MRAESPPVPSGLKYGPVPTWKEIFKQAASGAARVGSTVVEPQSELFVLISQLVHQFQPRHIEICKGTERFRVPKAGVDLADLRYRFTVILNRESGQVEILGDPEEWKTCPKQSKSGRPNRPV